jgi:Lon protease-like protein
MADEYEEMPLFPLHAVVFPYSSMQLHVFEDRYKSLIRTCLEFDRPFGIVLIRAGDEVGGPAEPYMVGTAVRVAQVHTYDDGRMDVRVQGERRFRVRRLDRSKSYLVSYVEPVVEFEVEDTPRSTELVNRAQESFKRLVETLFERTDMRVKVRTLDDPTALSFAIASFLELDNLVKQRLLETTDTLERLADLTPLIEKQLAEVQTPRYYRLGPADLEEWMSLN